MKKKRIGKGDFGYLKSARKKQIVLTILLFAMAFTIFFVSAAVLGTKKNYFTILAVLCMLPASKNLVTVVMFCKAGNVCTQKVYDAVCKYEENITILYDLYYTSEKMNFPVSCLAIRGKTICYLIEGKEKVAKECQRHLETVFCQNQFNGYTLKAYTSLDRFTERLEGLEKIEAPDAPDAFVVETLLSIAL